MDRLQRTERKRERERESDEESDKDWCDQKFEKNLKKSVALAQTNQDIGLNLSLFFAFNELWRSVHDFPHCPSWEACSQQEPLSHPTLNSQNC